jgi:hypothetical protein
MNDSFGFADHSFRIVHLLQGFETATNVLTEANHYTSPSITMNYLRYIIYGRESQRRQWVLSCPGVLLPQHSSDDEVFAWLRLRS